MLVVHANWTNGALHLWAESLDARITDAAESAEPTSDDGGRRPPRPTRIVSAKRQPRIKLPPVMRGMVKWRDIPAVEPC